MKIFDYFYENYLIPLVEGLSETFYPLIENMLNLILVVVLFITTPVWLIPYLIIKYIKERKAGNSEQSNGTENNNSTC